MAPRVHSSSPASSPSSSPRPATSTGEQRKVFTVWMKSLVLNGHGCTVYDSGGGIVYRVDNYGSRCSGSVCLMDLDGAVVLNVVKKKLAVGRWEGYKFRWSHGRPASSSCEFRCDTTCRVTRYTIANDECRAGSGKRGCRIVDDAAGLVVAEVRRKVTASGVALGEDVLSLVVEPGTDLSLVMGLVLVYGLMNRSM
ncbi:protein LURP-one-related 11-like [Panicum miliaceum]|uniref:Protein LURP-one-related 11-like n=1 Tax=Panicum miliaceum TaxID=4540 RepID=A0A3L6TAG0_PANMI|nr:protein LURP-one-related 11-like [Panicum miliaceum]